MSSASRGAVRAGARQFEDFPPHRQCGDKGLGSGENTSHNVRRAAALEPPGLSRLRPAPGLRLPRHLAHPCSTLTPPPASTTLSPDPPQKTRHAALHRRPRGPPRRRPSGRRRRALDGAQGHPRRGRAAPRAARLQGHVHAAARRAGRWPDRPHARHGGLLQPGGAHLVHGPRAHPPGRRDGAPGQRHERDGGLGHHQGHRDEEPGEEVLPRPGLLGDHHPPGDPAQHPREPRLVRARCRASAARRRAFFRGAAHPTPPPPPGTPPTRRTRPRSRRAGSRCSSTSRR